MNSQTISKNRVIPWVIAPQRTQLEIIKELARKEHSEIPQVIRRGGMINDPLVEGKWRYEPFTVFSIIPADARERLDLILSNISPLGVIIGDEIVDEVVTQPRILPAPWIVAPEVKPLPWVVSPEERPFRFPQPREDPLRKIDWEKVGQVTWNVTKVVGLVALGSLAILGAAVGALFDPALIIVTENEEWVEVYRWFENNELSQN